ncbi:MAG: hypothetical protein J6Y03_02020, partial [Alphaproteobacteria bacterium]|nr:hypothetical protein [Alphaproteobacteria bacterium]
RCGSNCCEPGQDCCAGECIEKVECPENQRYDSNACECRCGKDAAGMRLESDGKGGCKCPTDSNGRRMSLVNGYCTCVEAGFTVVGGNCKRMDCRGGTTGNTFNCYIDNVFCGYNCDSTGHTCGSGICDPSNCKPGEEFVKKARHNNGMYNYACKKHVRNGYDCYYHKWGGYACYKNGTYCCDTTNTTTFECMTGLCGDESLCKNVKPSASMNGNSCDFSDRLTCGYNSGKWDCYKYGYYCATCTAEQISNGTCCSENKCHVSSTTEATYNSETDRCEYKVGDDTVSCSTTAVGSSAQTCYVNGEKRCGIYTSYYNRPNYASGRCPEAASSCPPGTKYDLVWNGIYDCKNQTPNAPVCMYSDNNIMCVYDGKQCGQFCDYFGGNCKKVYLPQCASEGHCTQNGYDMTNNPCTCDGAVSSGLVTVKDENGNDIQEYHEFCCPAGHTYTNGGCAII